MRKINKAGFELIKGFEGLFLHPYLDSVKVPTIGWGTIMYENGTKVTMHDPAITADRAEQLLEWEVGLKADSVEKMVTASINDNEFGALVSFAYNLGTQALHGSTLLKLLNAGQDKTSVADQFLRWNKAGGKEIAGLTRRRQAERALFLQPMVQSDSDLLPSGPSDDDIDKALKGIEDDVK
jgi:lysozyme